MSDTKKQIWQISEFLGQFREQGKLHSSIVMNPKGDFETAKAITLRSGKQVGTDPQQSKSIQKEDEKLLLEEEEEVKPTTRVEKPLPQPPKASKPSLQDEKYILETFMKVQVNIPFLDAIKQNSKYAKFFKKLCTTRKRISEKEVVHVSDNVSAMLQRKLPPKCKDPGSFIIPCVIGELKNDGVIIQLANRFNAYPK
ncbi:hypothetical protein ACFX11_018483 [Malus domestica]